MGGQNDSAVTLPKNVSVIIGGRTFRGECPGRLIVPEHKLRKAVEIKKNSAAGKSVSKAADKVG